MASEFIVVSKTVDGERLELPTEPEDNTLSLHTLRAAFPGAHGLKYIVPGSRYYRTLLVDPTETKFFPPPGGWHGFVFIALTDFNKATAAVSDLQPKQPIITNYGSRQSSFNDETISEFSLPPNNGGNNRMTPSGPINIIRTAPNPHASTLMLHEKRTLPIGSGASSSANTPSSSATVTPVKGGSSIGSSNTSGFGNNGFGAFPTSVFNSANKQQQAKSTLPVTNTSTPNKNSNAHLPVKRTYGFGFGSIQTPTKAGRPKGRVSNSSSSDDERVKSPRILRNAAVVARKAFKQDSREKKRVQPNRMAATQRPVRKQLARKSC